jgi:hypothetical protein
MESEKSQGNPNPDQRDIEPVKRTVGSVGMYDSRQAIRHVGTGDDWLGCLQELKGAVDNAPK